MALNLLNFLLVVSVFDENTVLEERSGISQRTGKPWSMRSQKAYYKKSSERFPRSFKFPVPDGQFAYAPGHYLVDPNSFTDGDFDALELSRYDFALTPVPVELLPQLGLDPIVPAKGATK